MTQTHPLTLQASQLCFNKGEKPTVLCFTSHQPVRGSFGRNPCNGGICQPHVAQKVKFNFELLASLKTRNSDRQSESCQHREA